MRDDAMKWSLSLTIGLLTVFLPQPATAGPLYGTLRLDRAPAAGFGISVTCPRLTRPVRTTTDPRGSFSMLVPTSGRCQMRVTRGQREGTPFAVFVSDRPLRLDVTIDSALNRVR